MIWTILGIITLSIITILVIISGLLLFSPVRLTAKFAFNESRKGASLYATWLHPRIVSITYDSKKKSVRIALLGRRLGGSSKKKSSKDSDEPPKTPMKSETGGETAYISTPSQSSVEEYHEESSIHRFTPPSYKETPGEENHEPDVFDSNEVVQDVPPPPPSSPPPSPPEPPNASPEGDTPKAPDGGSENNKKKKKKKKPNIIQKIKQSEVFFLLQQKKWRKKVVKWLWRVIKSIFRIIYCHIFRLDVRAGIEDPAQVGRVYGWLNAIENTITPNSNKVALSFSPVFLENHLEFDGRLGITTSGARLIGPVLVAVFTFPYLSSGILWWRLRKRKKVRKMAAEVV